MRHACGSPIPTRRRPRCYLNHGERPTRCLPEASSRSVHAAGPEGGATEVAVEKGVVAVWAWPGSTVRLFQGETELGGNSRRPAVPHESAQPSIRRRAAPTDSAANETERTFERKRERRISLTVTDESLRPSG